MSRVDQPAERPYSAHNRHPLPSAEIAQRHLAGDSVLALARAYGVSRDAIARRLHEQGITPRGQHETELLKWSRMTPEQRTHQVAAAHVAATGRVPSSEERARNARTRSVSRPAVHIGNDERLMMADLEGRGIAHIPQHAIGPYNIDIAVGDTVAVEIFGGNWHASGEHAARAQERSRYILNAGWHLLIVWIDQRRYPYSTRVADDLIAFMQKASRDPAGRGEYRVIHGDGKLVARGRANDDYLAVETPNGRRPKSRT